MKSPQQYEVVREYGAFRVGAIISPTGLWRDVLLQRGWIRKLETTPEPVAEEPAKTRKRKPQGEPVAR